MASWVIHMRITDALADLAGDMYSDFAAGNLAPDCGKIQPDGSFLPDSHVTHWTKSGKGACDYMRFWNTIGRHSSGAEYVFMMGYLTHLITDVLWVRLVSEPCKAANRSFYECDRKEYYRQVKADWYALDMLYLQSHPNLRAWNQICGMPAYDTGCLPYYDTDNVTLQLHRIVAFYKQGIPVPERFRYLTSEQADAFVKTAAGEIRDILNTNDVNPPKKLV